MAYTNSSLVTHKNLSPNKYTGRVNVTRITPHCVVGQCSIETLGNIFAPSSRQASCNYGIGFDGKIGMYVEEKNTSWCSSSKNNDERAITIECASDTYDPYRMNDCVYESLVKLCVDICKRYGKKKLLWFDDKIKTLAYTPESDEMVITVHRWFANKSCPGDWLYSRLGDLAKRVTNQLGNTQTVNSSPKEEKAENKLKIYRIRKTWEDSKSQIGAFSVLQNAINSCKAGYKVFDENGVVVYPEEKENISTEFAPYKVRVLVEDLLIRTGAGVEYVATETIQAGVYTIVEEKQGKLRDKSLTKWGRLKSGAGWICLDYCERI